MGSRRRGTSGRHHPRRRIGLASRIPRGSRPGHVHKGVCPGTWENPEISAIQSRVGSGRSKVQAPSRVRPYAGGANQRSPSRYRQAKETKRGGMDSGRLSTFIVPRKRGNRPEGPRGGKGVSGHRTVGGKDGKVSEP